MGWIEAFSISIFCINQFVENKEQPVWIDRTGVQIIITVFAVIEMKTAQFFKLDKPSDNHFDIHVRCMMAKINQAPGFRSQFLCDQVIGAPVLNYG